MAQVAVVIPCHNEAGSIGRVIADVRQALPDARIVVCDNASNDGTGAAALEAKADVLFEGKRGKGNAMRRLFRDVEADIYVMIDGDNTYGTEILEEAIDRVGNGCDMVVGSRRLQEIKQRRGHDTGNQLFTKFFRSLFDVRNDDVFSGLRVLSRRLVKTFPCISLEFEIEAELEIYCARMRLPTSCLPVAIREREGSVSKLNTLQDGSKILWLAIRMLHREYPLRLYGMLSITIAMISAVMLTPVIKHYWATGLVPRFPSLIVGTGLMLLAAALLVTGLVLKEITNNRYETRYLNYLAQVS